MLGVGRSFRVWGSAWRDWDVFGGCWKVFGGCGEGLDYFTGADPGVVLGVRIPPFGGSPNFI